MSLYSNITSCCYINVCLAVIIDLISSIKSTGRRIIPLPYFSQSRCSHTSYYKAKSTTLKIPQFQTKLQGPQSFVAQMTRPWRPNDIIVKIVTALTAARDIHYRKRQIYTTPISQTETKNGASVSIIGGERELERRTRRFQIWNRFVLNR